MPDKDEAKHEAPHIPNTIDTDHYDDTTVAADVPVITNNDKENTLTVTDDSNLDHDDKENTNISEDGNNNKVLPHKHTYNTTGTKPQQYDKVYGTDYTFAVALTQMSANRGI